MTYKLTYKFMMVSAAAVMLVSCGSGSTGSNPAETPAKAASTSMHAPQSGVQSAAVTRPDTTLQQLPILPQRAGAVGPPVAGGLAIRPNVAPAAIKYPANSTNQGPLLSQSDVASRLNLTTSSRLHLTTMNLKLFGQIKEVAAGRFGSYAVDNNRVVYEVMTAFRTPLTRGPLTWSSGTEKIVVDAATGDVLYTLTNGTLVDNKFHDIYLAQKKASLPLKKASDVAPAHS